MNDNNYRIVLEELFKAGSLDRKNMPKYIDEMSIKEQVNILLNFLIIVKSCKIILNMF